MGIYLVFFISNSIFSFCKKNKYIFFFFGFLFMFFIFAFRSQNLGVDLDNYEMYYNFYSKESFKYLTNSFLFPYFVDKEFNVEYGYVFWGWFVSRFHFSFQGYLIINSLIYSIVVSWFIVKYSKNPFLSLVLLLGFGIFEYNFCILRQSLSVCFLLISVPMINKNRIKSFIFFVFLAFMFHRSSILFLPIYFLSKNKISFKSIGLSLFIVILLIPFSSTIYSFTYNVILSKIGKGLYISNSFSLNIILLLFLLMHIALLLLARKKRNIGVLSKYSVFIYMCFMGELLEVIALINNSFGRIAIMTYLNGAIILIPNIIDDFKKLITLKNRDVKIFFMQISLILLMFILFFHSMSNSSMEIVPYHTWFEEVNTYVK